MRLTTGTFMSLRPSAPRTRRFFTFSSAISPFYSGRLSQAEIQM
jgi:hypothetical protein